MAIINNPLIPVFMASWYLIMNKKRADMTACPIGSDKAV